MFLWIIFSLLYQQNPFVCCDMIENEINHQGKQKNINYKCRDYFGNCQNYNPENFQRDRAWFSLNCAKTFGTCHLLNEKHRCTYNTLNISSVDVYQSGDINKAFNNIITTTSSNNYDVHVLSSSPWVITIDNFLSDFESESLLSIIDHLHEMEIEEKIHREYHNDNHHIDHTSEDSEEYSLNKDVVRDMIRDPTVYFSAWCTKSCMDENEIIRATYEKMSQLIAVPAENFEHFLFVKYGPENDQGFPAHHDYNFDDLNKLSGPRILTFFLFLTDITEGGEREFVDLDIRVAPKRGRALLWVNTQNTYPDRIDNRTSHQDLPTMHRLQQWKFGVNISVYLRNYRVPFDWGCSSTFIDATR